MGSRLLRRGELQGWGSLSKQFLLWRQTKIKLPGKRAGEVRRCVELHTKEIVGGNADGVETAAGRS